MQNLTTAQITALAALRKAQRNSTKEEGKFRRFFTAEELGGVSGSTLAALIRRGLVEREQHHLADYVYGFPPLYAIKGLGLPLLGRIEREV